MLKRSFPPVTLAVLILAGCGTSGTETDTATPEQTDSVGKDSTFTVLADRSAWPEKIPSKGLVKDMVLPLEEYLTSYEDDVSVLQARRLAQHACIKRFGVTPKPAPQAGAFPDFANNAANMPRRYGLADLEEAQQYGYELPPPYDREPPADEEDPEADLLLTGTDREGAELKEYKGKAVPEGGCLKESDKSVGFLDDTAASELQGASFVQSMNSEPVKKAMAAWAVCMSERGYAVNTLEDTINLVHTGVADEIEIAVAEVECKQETGLVKTWFAEEVRIQQDMIAKSKDVLDKAASHNNKALHNAAEMSTAD